ncbi:MAG: hypothetical protein VX092_06360, partial [SAR324 cluster bacterium]|nr:hypothetical protein [SAR324 cluster bacterium]
MGPGSGDWDREWNQRIGELGSGRSGMGTGTRIWVSGDWDLGIPGPGSGCQRFPGTGIWGLGRLGGQILDTYIQFEGLGIEIRVSGFGDWNPWTGTWVSWDLGSLGSGDYGR